jgi:hypothetical protein
MNKQRIPPVDPATAIGNNKKNFDILKSALGFIPNMALAMAQSPAVLDGYMGLSVALIKGRRGQGSGYGSQIAQRKIYSEKYNSAE